MALTIYLKILISIDVLVRNVLRNHFLRHVARTAAEVSPRPQVATPELLLDMWKLGHQLVRRLPFQPLQQPTDRYLRRYGYEKVHVVSGYVPLHNRDLVLRTDVADQVPYPRRHFPTQSWPPIFRYPYQMQMDLEYGMRAVSVVWHPSSLICSARAEAVASRRGLEPTQTVTVTAVTSPDHKTL